VWVGIASVVRENDSAGNAVRVTNLDPEGKPVRAAEIDWSVREMKRNEHGEITQRTYLKADANGTLKQVSQLNIRYDDFGHPAHIEFVGESRWHSALRHEANGNVIEEQLINAKGEPFVGDNGYAIKRISYTPWEQGLRVEQTFFDPAGEKTYHKGGYHRLIDEFDINGNLRKQTMEEHDPAKYKYYRFVSEPEYDALGRMRRYTTHFEDAQGHLATNAGLLFTGAEEFYDENGRPTIEWKTGADVKRLGGPVVRVDTEWHANGKMKRWVKQVCDENRQPLPFIHTGQAAHYEVEYNSDGQQERIYETGFDEKLVGFSTREAKFSGGKFQSVTHTRNDGTVLDSVRVIITEIAPPAEQPKAAELQPGDYFVSDNGKPVTSAYAWAYGGTFPGGWIEILREGRRIRIEGLNPGNLGITLEDRALTAKQ
jgi:hypothetical protein